MNYHSLSRLVKDYFYGGSGLALARRDLVGLYVEQEQLQYICLSMTPNGWTPKSPGPALEPFGIIQEPAPWSLKQFLEWLTVLPLVEESAASKKKAIYLTLPRNSFSARELQLPPMPMEDALESIQNSLSVTCHLPLDEIYHDIHLCRTPREHINALIFYAPRKEMDVYLDIFLETNLQDALKGLFPVSFGLGAWLDLQGYPMPMGLILSQENVYELTLYQEGGCLFSGTWPISEGTAAGEPLIDSIKTRFEITNNTVFHMVGDSTPQLPPPPADHLSQFPRITENMGVAAVAPSLAGHQNVSIDGSLPRLATFKPKRLFIPLVLAFLLFIGLMHGKAIWDISSLKEKKEALSSEIEMLEQKVAPLEQKRKILRKAQRSQKDIETFMETRPKLFTLINEVARRVPDGTWFSHMIYEKGTLTLKGQSPEAFKTLEALRSSTALGQVNLNGAVSKDRTGAERFSIVIKLKADEDNQ